MYVSVIAWGEFYWEMLATLLLTIIFKILCKSKILLKLVNYRFTLELKGHRQKLSVERFEKVSVVHLYGIWSTKYSLADICLNKVITFSKFTGNVPQVHPAVT